MHLHCLPYFSFVITNTSEVRAGLVSLALRVLRALPADGCNHNSGMQNAYNSASRVEANRRLSLLEFGPRQWKGGEPSIDVGCMARVIIVLYCIRKWQVVTSSEGSPPPSVPLHIVIFNLAGSPAGLPTATGPGGGLKALSDLNLLHCYYSCLRREGRKGGRRGENRFNPSQTDS